MRRLPLLVLLAACDSPASPAQPELEFENGVVFGIPTLPITAVGSTGAIVVSGVIQTSSTGYSFFPTLRLGEANALTLEIDVQQTSAGFNFPTQNFYRARVLTLAPGDYVVTVIHQLRVPPPLRRFTVLRDTVRVD
jgi:hypothetical protein